MNDRSVFTLMPDFGGAWGWLRDDPSSGGSHVGPCVAEGTFCPDEFNVPPMLVQNINDWQTVFERGAFDPSFDWKSFHERGVELARRLCVWVPDEFAIRYHVCHEDPARSSDPDVWVRR
jgi:hypothetical protein